MESCTSDAQDSQTFIFDESDGGSLLIESVTVTIFLCKLCDFQSANRSDVVAHVKVSHTHITIQPIQAGGNTNVVIGPQSPEWPAEEAEQSAVEEKNECVALGSGTVDSKASCSRTRPRSTPNSVKGRKILKMGTAVNVATVKVPETSGPSSGKYKKLGRVCKPRPRIAPHGASERQKEKHKFPCCLKYCPVKLSTEENLKIHIKCHNMDRNASIDAKYVCPVRDCSAKNSKWFWLKNHLYRSHSIDVDMKKCDFAGCRFAASQEGELKKHSDIHSDEVNHFCQVCKKGFKQKNQLISHRVTHFSWQERNQPDCHRWFSETVCPVCKFNFANSKSLSRHMKYMHQETEKEFACDKCEYKTPRKHDLSTHVECKHSQSAKKYICSECGFATDYSSSFQRHMRTHSGEKDFACQYCDHTCSQPDVLRRHIAIKHGDKEAEWKCPLCVFESISTSKFRRHMSHHHPEICTADAGDGHDTTEGEHGVRSAELGSRVPLEIQNIVISEQTSSGHSILSKPNK